LLGFGHGKRKAPILTTGDIGWGRRYEPYLHFHLEEAGDKNIASLSKKSKLKKSEPAKSIS
jgi:hypothetical protein